MALRAVGLHQLGRGSLAAERIRGFIGGTARYRWCTTTGSWGVTKNLSRRLWICRADPTTTSGSLCSGAARAGQAMDFGIRLGHDPSDFVDSRLVLFWGRNPMATHLHTVPPLKEIRAAGPGDKAMASRGLNARSAGRGQGRVRT